MVNPWKRAIPDNTSLITPGAKLGHEFNTLISFSKNIVKPSSGEVVQNNCNSCCCAYDLMAKRVNL
ncbi:choline transporter protein 1 [Senna tora]|uniref:Choline transporter protein 1 n=1 Tax=Senna tora TaxID=362788 RepID=A0A834T1M9_9FABA|nr:choline transporter protein 1 [Senna tora]